MVKRLFSVFMALTIAMGVFAVTFAQGADNSSSNGGNAKISKEQAENLAIAKMKDYFGIDLNAKDYEVRIEYNQDFETRPDYVWQISFQRNTNDKYFNYNIGINSSTGRLSRFDKSEHFHRQEQIAVATITEEQAKKIAESLLKKINPEEFKQIKLDEPGYMKYGYMSEYNFRYVRIVNNIEYADNSIGIGIDGNGTVCSYHCIWDDNFQPPALNGDIGKDKADEAFKNNLKFTLRYIPYRTKYDYGERVSKVNLVYMPDYLNGMFMDAKDGALLNFSGLKNNSPEVKTKDLTEKEKDEFIKGAGEIKKPGKELDRDTAEAMIREKIRDFYGDGYSIDSIGYSEDGGGPEPEKKVWQATFSKGGNPGGNDSGSININAITGRLMNIDKWNPFGEGEYEKAAQKLTWEESYNRAVKHIAKQYPDRLKDLDIKQTYQKNISYINNKRFEDQSFYFSFPRLVKGIPYEGNNITIDMDAQTGEVRSLWCGWDESTLFPDASKAIKAEEAAKLYFNAYKTELVYKRFDEEKDALFIKPVYVLKPVNPKAAGQYIDAVNGKFIDFMGQTVDEKKVDYKGAIKGHWAEKELDILISQGIIDENELSDPNKKISNLEAMKIIANSTGNVMYGPRGGFDLKFKNISKDNENYKYLQRAVEMGILENKEENFDGEVKVTRQDAAVLFVKLIKYDKLAKAMDIFALPFSDSKQVDADKFGAVAICRGMGIFRGENSKFRPKDEMTYAEFAVCIYRTLESMKVK